MVFPILGFSLYRFQEITMLQNIRIIIAIALAAGIIWNCGGDRVTQSEIGTDEQIGRP